MLSEEQTQEIKKQIIFQLEQSNIQDKEKIKSSIEVMNAEQLEEFLKKNNLIKNSSQDSCVFCSIISGSANSYKIDENEKAVAVLEINPISKAHVLVVPKEHVSSSKKLPKEIHSLAEKIAKRIKTQFKPKKVIISPVNLFGHEIINILPVYGDETINSERKQAKPEELQKVQKLLEEKQKPKIIRKPKIKKISEPKLWLPRRIP